MKSPLRYPGGKNRAAKHILPFFPQKIEQIVSPFFGGGSIEIKMAEFGKKVYGYDLFEPLVDFWIAVKNNQNDLVDKCKQIQSQMDGENFKKLQSYLRSNVGTDRLDIAAVYFSLNRSSFSGTVLSGGYSPGHPRFNLSSIERILEIDMKNISVEHKSFIDSISSNADKFLYCDPPYLIKNSNLYGNTGDLHRDFDHIKLKELLTSRKNWLLSYNDCGEIREMYHGYEIVSPKWKYGMSSDKNSKEVLIINY